MDAERRFDRIEKRLDAITKLIRVGMKLVVDAAEVGKDNEYRIRALIDAQQRTDAKLNRLIDALYKTRSNGR